MATVDNETGTNESQTQKTETVNGTLTLLSAGSFLPVLENVPVPLNVTVSNLKQILSRNSSRLSGRIFRLYRESDTQFSDELFGKRKVFEEAGGDSGGGGGDDDSHTRTTLVVLILPSWSRVDKQSEFLVNFIAWNPRKPGIFAAVLRKKQRYPNRSTSEIVVCDVSKMTLEDVDSDVEGDFNTAQTCDCVMTSIAVQDLGFAASGPVTSLQWHPDGDRVAVAGTLRVTVWDTKRNERVLSFACWVSDHAELWNFDGKYMAVVAYHNFDIYTTSGTTDPKPRLVARSEHWLNWSWNPVNNLMCVWNSGGYVAIFDADAAVSNFADSDGNTGVSTTDQLGPFPFEDCDCSWDPTGTKIVLTDIGFVAVFDAASHTCTHIFNLEDICKRPVWHPTLTHVIVVPFEHEGIAICYLNSHHASLKTARALLDIVEGEPRPHSADVLFHSAVTYGEVSQTSWDPTGTYLALAGTETLHMLIQR